MMRGYNAWNYAPYIPAGDFPGEYVPYICRLAPGMHSLEGEWLDRGFDGGHVAYVAALDSDQWLEILLEGPNFIIDGLESDAEYQLYIRAKDGRKSRIRRFRTGSVPGTIINYLHPLDEQYAFSGSYLCSPSLVILKSGAYLASMDLYGHAAPQNLTLIFRSDDKGKSWRYVTDIFPCFWGKMFEHADALYMLGVSNEYGDLLIGKSTDEGKTWSTPTVIMRGASHTRELGHHRAPMVMLKSHGRIWTGSEFGCWHKKEFRDALLSIDVSDDLMLAENWSCTGYLRHDTGWPGAEADVAGAIEGNAVEMPDGGIIDFLRYAPNKALILSANPDDPEAPLRFERFCEFPLAHTKFEIQRAGNGWYYAVGNIMPGRTVLCVYRSQDLIRWDFCFDVVNEKDKDIKQVGFQYPSFCFDGDEIVVMSRTAYNQAHNFHDSNFMTLHRFRL